MLVSPEAGPLVGTALDLVAAAAAEGDQFPVLRAGIATGPTLPQSGDFYGRSVNLASRVTGIARPGSVLVDTPTREAAGEDGFEYSFAGERRLKGIDARTKLFRVRRVGEERRAPDDRLAPKLMGRKAPDIESACGPQHSLDGRASRSAAVRPWPGDASRSSRRVPVSHRSRTSLRSGGDADLRRLARASRDEADVASGIDLDFRMLRGTATCDPASQSQAPARPARPRNLRLSDSGLERFFGPLAIAAGLRSRSPKPGQRLRMSTSTGPTSRASSRPATVCHGPASRTHGRDGRGARRGA